MGWVLYIDFLNSHDAVWDQSFFNAIDQDLPRRHMDLQLWL